MPAKLRILHVFGTRPEAIKLAPVINELRRRRTFQVSVCVTAQHRGLLDQVLEFFRLQPDYDLNIMTEHQTLFQITTKTLTRLQPVLRRERPDVLFVQGDTTTAFASALAAFYEHIPVAHVEAGLRTYDLTQPYPEELNRRLIAPIARFNFAPTATARKHLLAERIPRASIFVTGNTVIDVLLQVTRQTAPSGSLDRSVATLLRRLTPSTKLLLVTAHRRENFGAPLENICQALRSLVQQAPDVEIVYPVHPNPNVAGPVFSLLGRTERIHLLPALDYFAFAHLLKRCYLVLTDSGGLQEEAPALGKPVLVLREKTERPEAIRAGTARLVGTDPRRILRMALRLLTSPLAYQRMARAHNPFGDGQAARRIADFLQFTYGYCRHPPHEFV